LSALLQKPPGVIVVGRILVLPMVLVGAVLVVASGAEIVGTVGANGVGPTNPTMGETAAVGTAGVALTPRLPISVEPNGIPVRAIPPGAVAVVEVGVDDETTLLEPEPHIPDMPAVSSVPEVADTPDVPRMLEIPGAAAAPDIAVVPVIDGLPAVVAVAGDPVPIPIPIPPPSKLAVDPNIDDGAVPTVEHALPLDVLGIAIVPVTPVGAGLSPGEVISVAPSGMPVGSTEAPGATPSGEVAPRVGVVAMVPTCATAPLQAKSAGITTASTASPVGILCSDIGQSPGYFSVSVGARSLTCWFAKNFGAGVLARTSCKGNWLAASPVQLNTSLASRMALRCVRAADTEDPGIEVSS
jgi:hypothetical protein